MDLQRLMCVLLLCADLHQEPHWQLEGGEGESIMT